MGKMNFDEYIDQSQEFSKPILKYIRECVHEACPEVQEEIKWKFPCFMYKKKILCNMAGFKNHVAFGFWLGGIMDDPDEILLPTGDSGMGNLGKITSIEDLPPKSILIKYIHQAMRLTDEGKKLPGKKTTGAEIVVPEIIQVALIKNNHAGEMFHRFSPSHKREYIEWINEAKTEVTREKRLSQMMEWVTEGKSKNWKYMK